MNPTARTKLRRKPGRGSHDRAAIEAILDEAIVSHLGILDDGLPVVTPTLHARIGAQVYVHGSAASRTLRAGNGAEVCLTATLLDGLVLARAALHHSANYRSTMVFGRAEPVDDPNEKLVALEALTEKLVAGRWADVRPPTEKELRATSVLRIPLEEASAKVRSGPPVDDEADYKLSVWAGTIALGITAGEPESDPRVPAGTGLPAYLSPAAGLPRAGSPPR